MITVPNDYKEPVSPQSSLSEFPQDSTPLTAVKNSLHGSNNSQNDEMEVQEASNGAPLTVIHDSKTRQKKQKLCNCFFHVPEQEILHLQKFCLLF